MKEMKKFRKILHIIYRIWVVKPDGRRIMLESQRDNLVPETDRKADSFIKQIIATDDPDFETDAELQQLLAHRVAGKRPPSLVGNSLGSIFLPLFSLRNIELKMATITLALVLSLGIGPTGNHPGNRSIYPAFYADTLVDSSRLLIPVMVDTAAK
jgi:hypothetical protein